MTATAQWLLLPNDCYCCPMTATAAQCLLLSNDCYCPMIDYYCPMTATAVQ